MKRKESIDFKDIMQILAGSLAAGIVFAPNNEFREISQSLPEYKIVIIFIFTLFFSGLMAYWIGGRKLKLKEIKTIFYVIPVRLMIIYGLSILSCIIALWIYDVITINNSLDMILREIVLLSLPATWGGTLLDLVYSKNK